MRNYFVPEAGVSITAGDLTITLRRRLPSDKIYVLLEHNGLEVYPPVTPEDEYTLDMLYAKIKGELVASDAKKTIEAVRKGLRHVREVNISAIEGFEDVDLEDDYDGTPHQLLIHGENTTGLARKLSRKYGLPSGIVMNAMLRGGGLSVRRILTFSKEELNELFEPYVVDILLAVDGSIVDPNWNDEPQVELSAEILAGRVTEDLLLAGIDVPRGIEDKIAELFPPEILEQMRRDRKEKGSDSEEKSE